MSDMPDEKFEADKSCTLCHGHGLYVVGSSGSADDGDAPIYEGCDCAIKYISAAKAKADKLALCDEIEAIAVSSLKRRDGDNSEFFCRLNEIKQRIEAE